MKKGSVLTYQSVPLALSRGDLRKKAIVEATVSILANQGVQNLTFEAIGKSCRIGKSHVAYHFPSLEELLTTCVSYVYSVGQKIVSDFIVEEKQSAKLLQAYIKGTFHWVEIHPEHASIAALLLYLATWDKQYRDIHSEIKSVGRDRIVALLHESTGKTLKSHLALADTIQSLLMGKILYFSSTKNRHEFRQVKVETWEAIRALLP